MKQCADQCHANKCTIRCAQCVDEKLLCIFYIEILMEMKQLVSGTLHLVCNSFVCIFIEISLLPHTIFIFCVANGMYCENKSIVTNHYRTIITTKNSFMNSRNHINKLLNTIPIFTLNCIHFMRILFHFHCNKQSTIDHRLYMFFSISNIFQNCRHSKNWRICFCVFGFY